MSVEPIPNSIKISKDADIINGHYLLNPIIVNIEKLTLENFKSLVAYDKMETFEKAINGYNCDACDSNSSETNPIYTNKDHKGVDICSKCIKREWPNMIKEKEIHNLDSVYSLKKIVGFALK